ncbi:MAG: hypothetical protein CFE47_10545 [Pseudomonas sp. PGPPP1]|uniref:oxamate carbamoyltransferase subunit AllG family protein n=1 Tax=Pseudomonas sp. PGPPP1 TaxID=2015553 RepID=UPI000BC639BE|nr:DUF1116 domain-containing protein [Pseudomonas sp. PGPPP1]OYU07770.1 MAG: hypothetical protein CFE47_10545 [Pseudomonas sp. PGPPP1]
MSETHANTLAVERILATEPVLVGAQTASSALGLQAGHLGHAGLPFAQASQIPPVVLNALAGAALHEGWAGDLGGARRLILDGEIILHANHDLGTVSPMAGVVRPGQLLMRIENRAGNEVVHATLAESGRRALRFGCYDSVIAEQLDYLDRVIGPSLIKALPAEGLPLLPLIAQGVALGDDTHQRNVGAMYAFAQQLPGLQSEVRQWLLGNPQHFLNYAMAAAKLSLDRASGIQGSSIITAIARNGVHCGVRIAGAGQRWFTHAATQPHGCFFPPHEPSDGQPDLGDSAIVEAYGLGGTIAHAAPELARLMGQDWTQAEATGRRMRQLFTGQHPLIAPALAGVDGAGAGLDARAVVAAGEPLRIHTGIAHRDGATGWIGIGVALAPVECFQAALAAL